MHLHDGRWHVILPICGDNSISKGIDAFRFRLSFYFRHRGSVFLFLEFATHIGCVVARRDRKLLVVWSGFTIIEKIAMVERAIRSCDHQIRIATMFG